MHDALALKRRRLPPIDPRGGAIALFSLIAATGFATGWALHALGGA
jgi:hypothetical protein